MHGAPEVGGLLVLSSCPLPSPLPPPARRWHIHHLRMRRIPFPFAPPPRKYFLSRLPFHRFLSIPSIPVSLSIYLSLSLLFLVVFPLLRPTSFPCVRVPRQRGEGKRGGTRKREARRERREKAGDGEVNKGGKGNQKESKNGIRERRMGGRKGKGD